MNFSKYIHAVGTGAKGNRDLSFDESKDMMTQVLDQSVHSEQIAAFLLGWRLKPETTEEFRGALSACDSYIIPYEVKNSTSVPNLTAFKPISECDLSKTITISKSKSCQLDPIPTSLLKSSINIMLPIIHKIVNMLLTSGIVPSPFKCATVTPLLKNLLLIRTSSTTIDQYPISPILHS